MRLSMWVVFLAACAPLEPAPTLEALPSSSALTEQAQAAIAIAPAWVRDDLSLAFRRLNDAKQDVYADVLLTVEDPNWIDEVAFSIAHLSPEVLTDFDFKKKIITENAEWIYKVDPELAYVEIVEHGVAGVDDDWWSTTSYTAEIDGQTVDFELERDVYYWYVVHPRIEDESPYYIDAWSDCGDEGLECPVGPSEGMFWREFLWQGAAETCPEGSFCPVLADAVPGVDSLWNGGGGGDATGAVRDIIDYMKSSDEVSGRWFEFGAYGERSIQPVRIYGLGRGNCGEWSDMTTAVSRTALIPNVNVNPSSWDHTWNAFWFEGDWIAWEPVNTWVDHPYGIGYAAYATRGDASTFMQTGDYNEETYTLNFDVRDATGVPVDGATVALFSPWVQGEDTFWWPAGELGTDLGGQASFEVVAGPEYAYRVDGDIGQWPADDSLTTADADGIAGVDHLVSVDLEGDTVPSGADLALVGSGGTAKLTFELSDEAGRIIGTSTRFGDSYTLDTEAPVLDLFLVDAANYDAFTRGEAFDTVQAEAGTARVDPMEAWYAVVSNGWTASTAAFGTLSVGLKPTADADFEGTADASLRYQLLPGDHVAIEVRP